jgi:hypothetical protein
LGKSQSPFPSVLQSTSAGGRGDHLGDLIIAGLGRKQETADRLAFSIIHSWQPGDQGKGHFVFPQVGTKWFAGNRGVFRIVEQIVDDLKCHAERLAKTSEGAPLGRPSPEGSDLAGTGDQRCRLGPDQQIVLFLGELQRIVSEQLSHLTDCHFVGDPAQHPQRFQIVQPHQLDHCSRIQVVAHDNRHLVAEQ